MALVATLQGISTRAVQEKAVENEEIVKAEQIDLKKRQIDSRNSLDAQTYAKEVLDKVETICLDHASRGEFQARIMRHIRHVALKTPLRSLVAGEPDDVPGRKLLLHPLLVFEALERDGLCPTVKGWAVEKGTMGDIPFWMYDVIEIYANWEPRTSLEYVKVYGSTVEENRLKVNLSREEKIEAQEPQIIINGTELTIGQTMTARVALNTFMLEMSDEKALGDDAQGKELTDHYNRHARAILILMMKQGKN